MFSVLNKIKPQRTHHKLTLPYVTLVFNYNYNITKILELNSCRISLRESPKICVPKYANFEVFLLQLRYNLSSYYLHKIRIT